MHHLLLGILALFLFTVNAYAKPRVAVIGGGVAGSKIVSLLAGSNIELHIFEAQDRIGGRSFSRDVKLSNGVSTTINVGTQMNFAQFLTVAPELKAIENLFYIPKQHMTVIAPSVEDGEIKVFGVERAHNPGDTDRAHAIGEKMVNDGLLSLLDLSLSGLTGYFMKTQHLDNLAFDNLDALYNQHPEWDQVTAEDFLNRLSFPIEAQIAWGDVWAANQLWQEYLATPIGDEKARLAAKILENGLYYGLLSLNGRTVTVESQRSAYFTRNYIRNVVQSMESLVEFTDLKSMSALNFIWQLKWVTSGGPFIVARSWNRIPDFYLKKNKSAIVHLNSAVQTIGKNADGRFALTIKTGQTINSEIFDVVINTADTDLALSMTKFEAPELKDLLAFNSYTSTIALHLELEQPAAQIFASRAGAALVAAPGILQRLGGMTFHTQLLGENLKGREIAGLFAQSNAAARLIQLAKQKGWSDAQLGQEMKKQFVEDLRNLQSNSYSQDIVTLRENIERGKILSTAVWDKALPHFAVGHMQKVANYRKVMGQDNYFYLGQALYGRSVIMVIAGLDRNIDLIRKAFKRKH